MCQMQRTRKRAESVTSHRRSKSVITRRSPRFKVVKRVNGERLREVRYGKNIIGPERIMMY